MLLRERTGSEEGGWAEGGDEVGVGKASRISRPRMEEPSASASASSLLLLLLLQVPRRPRPRRRRPRRKRS